MSDVVKPQALRGEDADDDGLPRRPVYYLQMQRDGGSNQKRGIRTELSPEVRVGSFKTSCRYLLLTWSVKLLARVASGLEGSRHSNDAENSRVCRNGWRRIQEGAALVGSCHAIPI